MCICIISEKIITNIANQSETFSFRDTWNCIFWSRTERRGKLPVQVFSEGGTDSCISNGTRKGIHHLSPGVNRKCVVTHRLSVGQKRSERSMDALEIFLIAVMKTV
jgi:hypothetical protein